MMYLNCDLDSTLFDLQMATIFPFDAFEWRVKQNKTWTHFNC